MAADQQRAAGTSPVPRSVGVYGLGRFGRYWASLLAQHYDVVACSRRSRDVPENVTLADERTVARQPVVFLCVAISSIDEVLTRLAPLVQPGALVADTCSIKEYPIAAMRRALPDTVDILGTHPMFGPDSGRTDVRGLPIVLHRERVADGVWAYWREFFSGLGLTVVEMTPPEHDREAAFTQGITHYLGRVMAEIGARESPMATVGYRKLAEIIEQTCNDSWQLFVDLQRYNPYTDEMQRQLDRAFSTVRERLGHSIDSGEPG